jgi:phosphoribosyl 1,2-cyclic phosphodiesterase
MKLNILGSDSRTGNCYILENDKEALVIECGVPFDKIKKALQFNLSKVSGCIVTHDHGDHAKAIHDMMKAGINVYATEGTHKACGSDAHHRAKVIPIRKDQEYGEQFQVGNFRVIPFTVMHDAAHPVGFLINHTETGTILFVTDTYYVKQKFRGLNNVIVEANFCQDILDDRLSRGENPKFLRDRIFKSHMSLATCKGLLQANDLRQVNNIVLIHLSDGNSNAEKFKREVTELTGKMVHVAEAGMCIPFTKNPF